MLKTPVIVGMLALSPALWIPGQCYARERPAHRIITVSTTTVFGGLPIAEPLRSSPRPRIGLALAGGGARAAASIGVLKVLKREGIPIAAIAGTSMGSLVGGLAAAGYPPDRIEDLFVANDWNDLFTDTPARAFLSPQQRNAGSRHLFQFSVSGGRFMAPSGLTAGQKLSDLLTSMTLGASFKAGRDFDRLPIPFRAVATDLETGDPVALRNGFLHDALRASAAVPVLFPPVPIEGKLLVDGGIANNLPVDIVRSMGADFIIAVDASSPLERKERIKSLLDVLGQSISLPVRKTTERQAESADIVIVPDTGDLSFTDFTRIGDIVRAGEQAAEAALPAIRERLRERPVPDRAAEQIRFSSLTVEGNVSVPESEIRSFLARGLGTDGTSESDLIAALNDLFGTGMFSHVSLELIPAGNGQAATLHVKEFPVVRAVRIAGASIMRESDILDSLGEPLDRTLNVEILRKGLDRVVERYHEQGYVLANIGFAGMEPDGSTLSVEINEGRVDAIRLTGQRRTRISLLRREMRTKTGAPLNFPLLYRDVRHLYGLTYFESINLQVAENGKDGVTVTLAVKERHRGSVRLGLRYDSEDAFTGLTDAVVDNLGGRGIRAWLNTRYGNYLDLSMGYHSPVLVTASFVHAVEGFYRKRTYSLYSGGERAGEVQVARAGGDFSFGYEWFRFGETYLRYRFTMDRTTAIYGAVQPDNPAETASLAFLTSVDTRDDRYFPRSGALIQATYEVADPSYGGDGEFRKMTFSSLLALTVADRHAFIVEAAAGFGGGTLPYQEQYGIGGYDHLLGFPLPGYHRREFVGSNQAGALLTYRWQVAEYQLKPVRAVYVAASGGAANVWDSREEISTRDLWTGGGIGIHADTVVGPFRLDAGRGENRRYTFFLSAGFDF